MKKYLIYGLMLSVTWIFITGSATFPTFLQGLFFGMPASFAFRRFYPGDIRLSKLEKLPYLIEFFAIFLEALILSNLEVAYRLLRPSKSIDPEIIDYQSELNSPTSVAVLADAITLTPGTLVVDHFKDENKLKIHCLNGQCTKETREDIRKWEKLLKKSLG
mgnify:FL=1